MWLLDPDIDRKHRAAIGSERTLEDLVTRTQKEDWKIHEGWVQRYVRALVISILMLHTN